MPGSDLLVQYLWVAAPANLRYPHLTHLPCLLRHLCLLQMLLNKIALSQIRFRSANALLVFQCGLAAALVQACAVLGIVKLEPFSLRVAKVW